MKYTYKKLQAFLSSVVMLLLFSASRRERLLSLGEEVRGRRRDGRGRPKVTGRVKCPEQRHEEEEEGGEPLSSRCSVLGCRGDSIRFGEVYTGVGSVLRQRHRPCHRRHRAPVAATGSRRHGSRVTPILPQLQGNVVQAVLVAHRHVPAHSAGSSPRGGGC